jgi:hypothetical protein
MQLQADTTSMAGAAEKWAYAVGALVGAGTWGLVAATSGRQEAWDSDLYFTVALPFVGLSAAVLGFLVPDRAWRWAFVPFAAQAVVAFVQNPTGNLLPIGLIVFALFGVGCLVPAYIGARLARAIRGNR